jgi:hypothetical protein
MFFTQPIYSGPFCIKHPSFALAGDFARSLLVK